MTRRRLFTDAPAAARCQAVVTLRDKSTANCGRRATSTQDDGRRLCTQHARLAAQKEAR